MGLFYFNEANQYFKINNATNKANNNIAKATIFLTSAYFEYKY